MHTEDTTGQTLEHRFHEGDPIAVGEAYRRYAVRLRGAAYRILRDHDLAADAVQDAFVKAWRVAASYDPRRPLGAWLHAVVRRTAIDLYRRGGPTVTVDSAVLDARGDLRAATAAPDLEPLWVGGEVRAAVARLPYPEREVIACCYYRGRTHLEAAGDLDLPVGTVKSRLSRALGRLAGPLAHLDDRGPERVATPRGSSVVDYRDRHAAARPRTGDGVRAVRSAAATRRAAA